MTVIEVKIVGVLTLIFCLKKLVAYLLMSLNIEAGRAATVESLGSETHEYKRRVKEAKLLSRGAF